MNKLKLGVKTLRRLSNKEVERVAGAGGIGGGQNTVISGIGCDPDAPTWSCTAFCTVFFCPDPGPDPGPDPDPKPVTTFSVCSPGPA